MDMGVAETGTDMISFRKIMQKMSECKGYLRRIGQSVHNSANRVRKIETIDTICYIALMLDSGLRRNEVCTSDINKLDMEAGLLTVVGKGEKAENKSLWEKDTNKKKKVHLCGLFSLANNYNIDTMHPINGNLMLRI